eukprot:m51a1_g6727 hypothetical protein (1304) ;mRNA; f:182041-187604
MASPGTSGAPQSAQQPSSSPAPAAAAAAASPPRAPPAVAKAIEPPNEGAPLRPAGPLERRSLSPEEISRARTFVLTLLGRESLMEVAPSSGPGPARGPEAPLSWQAFELLSLASAARPVAAELRTGAVLLLNRDDDTLRKDPVFLQFVGALLEYAALIDCRAALGLIARRPMLLRTLIEAWISRAYDSGAVLLALASADVTGMLCLPLTSGALLASARAFAPQTVLGLYGIVRAYITSGFRVPEAVFDSVAPAVVRAVLATTRPAPSDQDPNPVPAVMLEASALLLRMSSIKVVQAAIQETACALYPHIATLSGDDWHYASAAVSVASIVIEAACIDRDDRALVPAALATCSGSGTHSAAASSSSSASPLLAAAPPMASSPQSAPALGVGNSPKSSAASPLISSAPPPVEGLSHVGSLVPALVDLVNRFASCSTLARVALASVYKACECSPQVAKAAAACAPRLMRSIDALLSNDSGGRRRFASTSRELVVQLAMLDRLPGIDFAMHKLLESLINERAKLGDAAGATRAARILSWMLQSSGSYAKKLVASLPGKKEPRFASVPLVPYTLDNSTIDVVCQHIATVPQAGEDAPWQSLANFVLASGEQVQVFSIVHSATARCKTLFGLAEPAVTDPHGSRVGHVLPIVELAGNVDKQVKKKKGAFPKVAVSELSHLVSASKKKSKAKRSWSSEKLTGSPTIVLSSTPPPPGVAAPTASPPQTSWLVGRLTGNNAAVSSPPLVRPMPEEPLGVGVAGLTGSAGSPIACALGRPRQLSGLGQRVRIADWRPADAGSSSGEEVGDHDALSEGSGGRISIGKPSRPAPRPDMMSSSPPGESSSPASYSPVWVATQSAGSEKRVADEADKAAETFMVERLVGERVSDDGRSVEFLPEGNLDSARPIEDLRSCVAVAWEARLACAARCVAVDPSARGAVVRAALGAAGCAALSADNGRASPAVPPGATCVAPDALGRGCVVACVDGSVRLQSAVLRPAQAGGAATALCAGDDDDDGASVLLAAGDAVEAWRSGARVWGSEWRAGGVLGVARMDAGTAVAWARVGVRAWSWDTGALLWEWAAPQGDCRGAALFGDRLAVLCCREVVLLRPEDGRETGPPPDIYSCAATPACVCSTPCRRVLLVLFADGTAMFFAHGAPETPRLQLIVRQAAASHYATCDGARAYVAAEDRVLCLDVCRAIGVSLAGIDHEVRGVSVYATTAAPKKEELPVVGEREASGLTVIDCKRQANGRVLAMPRLYGFPVSLAPCLREQEGTVYACDGLRRGIGNNYEVIGTLYLVSPGVQEAPAQSTR